MEFWLINNDEKLQLPVPPPSYSIKKSTNSSTLVVLGLGEISFTGTSKLAEIPTIETFFPSKNYSFCQCNTFPTPPECIEMIEKWMNEGTIIRYFVTGTKLNIECTVESFEYGEKDSTGDINFSLQLKEYKRVVDVAKEGWVSSGGTWYSFKSNGTKNTGWLKDKDKWYFLKENGAMAIGWALVNNKWYFLNASGAMAIGWIYTGGKWYYLNTNGDMAANIWLHYNGKQYWLGSNGSMAVSTIIDGWRVGADGAWDGKGKS